MACEGPFPHKPAHDWKGGRAGGAAALLLSCAPSSIRFPLVSPSTPAALGLGDTLGRCLPAGAQPAGLGAGMGTRTEVSSCCCERCAGLWGQFGPGSWCGAGVVAAESTLGDRAPGVLGLRG